MVDIEEKHMLHGISNYWLQRKFEAYPFKIKWYNDRVKPVFRLPYADDTLAFIVLSVPGMFETTFFPFIRENESDFIKDPIDNCMLHAFNEFIETFSEYDIEVIHDFDLNVMRRPRVLVQTAGHVSGAAYLYQRSDVSGDPWGDKKIFNVSLHPKFGGWFGFRAVIIFKAVVFPNLRQIESIDVLKFRDKKIELLEKFNFHWRDSSYRDVIPVIQRYSDAEKLYFDTLPKERFKLIESWRSEMKK